MTRLNEDAAGVFVIAATPFTEEGALDLASVDTLVEFYLERGASGLTVLGMMGEAQKLTAEESARFVRRVLHRVGDRVPVVVGVTSAGFAAMGELAAQVMDDGAAGVMVAPPGTLKTDAQIIDYYVGVAETLQGAPFVLQDYPLSTGVVFSAGVLLKLAERLTTLVMIKHEDWPGLAKLSALRAASASGEARRLSILCGNGGIFLPEELSRGADGAMTGFAFPEMMSGVCAAFLKGDRARMRDLFDAYLPLARYELQPGVGLAVRKHLLCLRGAIASPALRRPGPKLSPIDLQEIDELLTRQNARLSEIN